MISTRHLLAALALASLATACDLNPQPLPPGEQPDGSLNEQPPADNGNGGTAAGAGDGGTASPPLVGSDASPDGTTDGATDGALDGAADGESDGALDAGDASD